jgi:carboxypeptidase Q
MKRPYGAILLSLLFFQTISRAQKEQIDTALMNRIRIEGLQHSQVRSIATHLMDWSGPRLTNSPGFKRAANWAIDAFRQWGMVNAQLEPWGEFGYGWEVEKSYLAFKLPYYESIIAYAKPWSGSTPGLVTAPVFLLDKEDSAYILQNAGNIKGKIVLYKKPDSVLRSAFKAYASRYSDSALLHLTDQYMITAGMLDYYLPIVSKSLRAKKMLQAAGAVALLDFDEIGRDGTVFVDGFGGYRKSDQPAIPELVLSKEAILKMERLLEDGNEVRLEMEVRTKLYGDDLKGYNVLAEIPGSDQRLKEELVMLGGPLDSWQSATGATDNGAGCIVMMEAVRILQTLGIKPRRTIRIALWSGEEQGLLGSFNYIKNHFGNPATMKLMPAQQKISVYFNLDNGTGKIRGIYDQGNEAVHPLFNEWLRPFADLGASTVTSHSTGATDHLSFDAVGIPGFQFVQDPIEYETRTHHSNMDTYDHLMLDDLKQAAVIVAAFIYQAATLSDKLPRKPLPKAQKFIFEAFTEKI